MLSSRGFPASIDLDALCVSRVWRTPERVGRVPDDGRVENRRSGGSRPVAHGVAFATPPQSGLT